MFEARVSRFAASRIPEVDCSNSTMRCTNHELGERISILYLLIDGIGSCNLMLNDGRALIVDIHSAERHIALKPNCKLEQLTYHNNNS